MDNVTLFLNTYCETKLCMNNDLFLYPGKATREHVQMTRSRFILSRENVSLTS